MHIKFTSELYVLYIIKFYNLFLLFSLSSMFIGNLFVFFKFQGLTHIDEDTRKLVIWVMCAISVLGMGFLLILPGAKLEQDAVQEVNEGPLEALKGAGSLFLTKEILLLSLTFLYTGK